MSKRFVLLAALLGFPGIAARAQTPSLTRQVFASDSIDAMGWGSIVSPDGRWLVFIRWASNGDSRLMIQPLAGGELRELPMPKARYVLPRFTPQGNWLVLASGLPRRGPADDGDYLVSVPFDSRTGILTGPPRQVSLDAVFAGPALAPAVSPDSRWVAYMAWPSQALKIVPIAGGNARTLVDTEAGFAWPTWTPDGRALLYETREGPDFVRKRISREGGAPEVVVRSRESMGFLTPDNQHSVLVERTSGKKPWILRVFGVDGRQLGEATIPNGMRMASGFSADGKYTLGTRSNSVAPIKVVPVAGGPIRQITSGETYDWADSWTQDGEAVYLWTEDRGRSVLELVTRGGEVRSKVAGPDVPAGMTTLGTQDGYLVYLEGSRSHPDAWRAIAMSLKDGSKRELVRNIRADGAVGPGGMYYALYGGEFYFQQLKGDRLQLHAMNLKGEARLVGEVSASLIGKTRFAVYQTRVVFTEPAKDSVRLQLVTAPGRQSITLGTFTKASAPVEMAWSHDGRQFTLYLGGSPQQQLLYRFSADGVPQGVPQVLNLPFEYWYETFWLPDGSGLTMIAQPKGAAVTEVALVKLADPQHPILLTKDDPVSKWGHSLSPDGKYVAYPSEHLKGSSIFLIEVAQLLKQVQAKQ